MKVWVQGCPLRDPLPAVQAAQAAGFEPELRAHGQGLSHADIAQWWRKQWLDVAAGCPDDELLLRVEDDVFLDPDAAEKLEPWKVVSQREDFGLGIMVPIWGTCWAGKRSQTFREEEHGFSVSSWVMGGQCQLIKAGTVRAALSDKRLVGHWLKNTMVFDTGIGRAIVRLGLRTYVQLPAIGAHASGEVSAVRGTVPRNWAMTARGWPESG